MHKEEPHAYVSFSPHPRSLLLIWSRRITCKLMMRVCAYQVYSCVRLFATMWPIARQAPLSIEFSRQKYRSTGEPLLPGALPNPGIKLTSFTPLHWQAAAAAAAKSLQSCPTLCDPIDGAAHQAPLSLGFSRQEHWSGLPFPSPMHESEKRK